MAIKPTVIFVTQNKDFTTFEKKIRESSLYSILSNKLPGADIKIFATGDLLKHKDLWKSQSTLVFIDMESFTLPKFWNQWVEKEAKII